MPRKPAPSPVSDQQFEIFPVLCGSITDVERSNLTLKRHEGEKVSIPSIVWVMRSKDETVVLDAGPGDPAVVRSELGRAFEPHGDLTETLIALGVEPAEVETVVISHLHWDHAGGLDLFSSARFYVQRRELHAAIAPVPAHEALYELDGASPAPPRWLRSRKRMTIVDGDVQLCPGLRLLLLPGHALGLMGIEVSTRSGTIVLASDAVPTFENWEDNIAPGIYVDLREAYATLDKLRTIPDAHVLPGHDYAVLERARYG
jgi:N-acyl homoserine lactone hydrolase